jgi:hypothetical protein
MKKIILISAIMLISFFSFTGCYTYLTLYDGAKLADVPYEPYFPPHNPFPPSPPLPPCIDCGWPSPKQEPVIAQYIPQLPPYERQREISDIRKGGDGRNPDNSGKRR